MKTKNEIINEVIAACNECEMWYKEIADAEKFEKKGEINARVDIDDKYYIFIDTDSENDRLNYFWFSLECEDEYDFIDEQDTSDISENSIKYNMEVLLDRNKDIIKFS